MLKQLIRVNYLVGFEDVCSLCFFDDVKVKWCMSVYLDFGTNCISSHAAMLTSHVFQQIFILVT